MSDAPRSRPDSDELKPTPMPMPGQGAVGWQSGSPDDTAPLPTRRVPDKPKFSAKSQRIIDAIEEGLRHPDCTQIDGHAHDKISAKLQGANGLFDGLAFANRDEYTAYLKWLVDSQVSETDVLTWEDFIRDRWGTVSLKDGSRLTIFLQPWHKEPTFSLRKHTATTWKQHELVERGTLDERMLRFLRSCVAAKVNIVIVGLMGTGKSSLLRLLAQDFADNEKIAVLEQVPELQIPKPLATHYLYQPTVEGMRLGDALEGMLYMGLDRLLVGELHMEGISKLLEVMMVSAGSMTTYHAQSAEMAVERMRIAVQMENPNFSSEDAIAFIKQGVELIVVLQVIDGKHRCVQIKELDWRESGQKGKLGGRDIFVFDAEQNRFRAKNEPDPDGRISAKFALRGIHLPVTDFRDPEDIERARHLLS